MTTLNLSINGASLSCFLFNLLCENELPEDGFCPPYRRLADALVHGLPRDEVQRAATHFTQHAQRLASYRGGAVPRCYTHWQNATLIIGFPDGVRLWLTPAPPLIHIRLDFRRMSTVDLVRRLCRLELFSPEEVRPLLCAALSLKSDTRARHGKGVPRIPG